MEYSGYEIIQSPRVTESENPIPLWQYGCIGNSDERRLGCGIRPPSFAPVQSTINDMCSSCRPQQAEASVTSVAALNNHVDRLSVSEPLCLAISESSGYRRNRNRNISPAAEGSCAFRHRRRSRCKNEVLWLDDDGEELRSWKVGIENEFRPVQHSVSCCQLRGSELDNEFGDAECVATTKICNIEGHDQITTFEEQHQQLHSSSSTTVLKNDVVVMPPASCSILIPPISDPGCSTYTRRILSAFHQVRFLSFA